MNNNRIINNIALALILPFEIFIQTSLQMTFKLALKCGLKSECSFLDYHSLLVVRYLSVTFDVSASFA